MKSFHETISRSAVGKTAISNYTGSDLIGLDLIIGQCRSIEILFQ